MSFLKNSLSSYLALIALLSSEASAQTVEASNAGGPWKFLPTNTVSPPKSPDERNRFGGWANHQVAEPGFFRVMEKDGHWWLVDPDGCLFFSAGLNSVRPTPTNLDHEKEWAEETYQLLTGNGFNTLGRWSTPQHFKKIEKEIPWCAGLDFMLRYKKEKGYPESHKKILTVFDEEWPAFCEKYALEKTAQTKTETYLIGYFSDNELPFRPNALSLYLALPKDDASYLGARAWMKENNIEEYQARDKKISADFLEEISKRYYDTVAAALKKADPNHLFLGSRINGRNISEPVFRASRACDVVSVNYYHRWEPEKERLARWTEWSQRPFLIGEFYAMKVLDKETRPSGAAGFWVLSHEAAGEFYHTYAGGMLKEIPGCVGYHWFKYADDNDNYHKGIVDQTSKPHETLLEAMQTLNSQTYSLR